MQSDYLYKLAEKQEYTKLVEIITTHSQTEVRYGAAGILVEEDTKFTTTITPDQQKMLVTHILKEPNDKVRSKIVQLLLQIDTSIIDTIIYRFKIDQTPNNIPYPLVFTRYTSKEWPLRYLAAAGFGTVGSQTTIRKLLTMLQNESHPKVLYRVIQESGEVGNEQFVDPLKRYIDITEEQFKSSTTDQQIKKIQEATVESLIKIGTSAAFEAVLTASRSRDDHAKDVILEKIGKFGYKDSIKVLTKNIQSESDSIQKSAASGAVKLLKNAENDTTRQQLIQELQTKSDSNISQHFTTIIQDSAQTIERRNAALILGELDELREQDITTLLETFDSNDDVLKIISASSLYKINCNICRKKLQEHISTIKTDDTQLRTFLQNLKELLEKEDPKKRVANYTYVSEPDDYSAR